jgi:mannosyltransferase
MASTPVRPRELAALVVILCLALGLRLYRLDAQSLWNDEGTSVALAQRDLATITRNAAADIHPPLYYYLLHFWVRRVGTGESAVRSLSVLAGLLLVGVTYLLARRFSGPGAALWATLFAALSPFQVYYAQEARMYIWVTLWGAISLLAAQRLLAGEGLAGSWRARKGWVALYLSATVAALYSHYLAFTLVLAQNVAFLWGWYHLPKKGRWRSLARWGLVQGALVAGYIPWLLLSAPSLRNWPAVSPALGPGELLPQMARVLALGVTVEGGAWVDLAVLILTLLLLPGLLGKDTVERDAPSPTPKVWAALHLVVPVVMLLLLSWQRPMYKPKFLLLASPGYYLLQGQGIAVLGRWLGRRGGRWLRATGMGVLALAIGAASAYSLWALYFDPRYQRDDYRGIVAYINATAGPQDAILINAPSQIETVDYYYRGPLPEYPLPAQRPPDPGATEAALEAMVARHPRLYAIFWATNESDPQGLVEGWLNRRCYKALDSWFGHVRLVVYAAPQVAAQEIAQPLAVEYGGGIQLLGYTLLTPQPRSGDILQLTLFWRAQEGIGARYKVFVHVVDGRGNIVGQRDGEPVGDLRPTTTWQPGEIIADNYGILLPPGTPPGEHTVRVGLYALEDGRRLPVRRAGEALGDAFTLARVAIQPSPAPPPLSALDLQRPDASSWGALRLVGHSLHRLGFEHEGKLTLRPGDVAKLVLFWQKGEGAPAQEGFVVALQDRKGRNLWEHKLRVTDGAFPLALWREGEVVRDIQLLFLPPALPPGAYRLVLRADGWAQDKAYTLEQIRIAP